MSDKTKFYQLCRANGVWRELPPDIEGKHPEHLLAADYDHRYFLMDCFAAEKKQKAKAAGEGAKDKGQEDHDAAEQNGEHSILFLRGDDPDLPELAPEKEWKREESSSFQEPVSVDRQRLEHDILERLPGIWDTGRVGSMEDEFVVFLPDGSGVIEHWKPELCKIDEFRWQMIAGERLLIEPSGVSEEQERRHGPFQYFGAAQLQTHLFEVTNGYGEKFDLLQISPLANPARRLELRRSKRLLGEYKRPDLD